MTDTSVGPHQLADRLNVKPGAINRGRVAGIIPPPDLPGGHRWSAEAATAMVARAPEIRAALSVTPAT